MAELDFSKIFGETATSKASFTDENYLSGWGYLGSTPPPYQLFDYLQSLNDKKSKYLYDKVNENDNNLLIHNTNATAHTDIRAKITSDINSHNTNATAHADIRTKITSDMNAHNTSSSAHTAILNAIKAISGMADYDIAPSSTLSSLIPLVGYGGIVAQRLEDTGYIKFANGFTVQWGIAKGNTSSDNVQRTFNTAFTSLFGIYVQSFMSAISNAVPIVYSSSNTGFYLHFNNGGSTFPDQGRYLAIGIS